MRNRPGTWVVIVAAALPAFIANLDNLVVTTALPAIAKAMTADVETLQWITTAYTLAFASGVLLAAALGDRFGRRRVLIIGLLIFGIASAMCAMSTTPDVLIIGRVLQGIGGSAMASLPLALLSSTVGAASRARALGVWAAISGLGAAIGPLVGGAIVHGWQWEGIFWLNVPVVLMSVLLCRRTFDEQHGTRRAIDVLSVLWFSVASLAAVITLLEVARDPNLSILLALAGGTALVTVILGLRRQFTARSPLIPPRLLRSRATAIVNTTGFLYNFGAFGAVFLLTQFLQIVQGLDALRAGVMTLPWSLAPMLFAPLAGNLTARFGARRLLTIGLTAQALGIGWIAVVLAPDTSYLLLLPAFLLVGFGMGFTIAPSSEALISNVTTDLYATTSGVNVMVRELGVVFGVAGMSSIFIAAGGTLTPTGFVDAAKAPILAGAVALALAATTALALRDNTADYTA